LIDSGSIVKKLPLHQGRVTIGRSDDADITISNKDVSRMHAIIHCDQSRILVEDLGSTNGTFVNGKRVTTQTLNVGDEVEIGDFILCLDDGNVPLECSDKTEIGRKGEETIILEDKFSTLREKLGDKNLRDEFRSVEGIVKKSRKRLSSLAHDDKLTGLYNRQYFDKIANEIFDEIVTKNAPLSVLFIDIDYFKRINDTHGHKKGDETLRTIAQLILRSCRKSDIVARYGGEEIVIILPYTGSQDAIQVAKNVNRIVENKTVVLLGIRVTVSIGVATYPGAGDTMTDILENADKALYKAKKSGRNRVINYHETGD
jgi:diguanylate cyclase (GGDEF)-like protein